MGRDGDPSRSTVPGLQRRLHRGASCDLGWGVRKRHPLYLGSDSSRPPGRELPVSSPLRKLLVTAAFQKALQAIVLINTTLFPLWQPSPCLLCVNSVFSMM